MSRVAAPPTTPRKTPQQARSNASVHAILQATLQVLRKHGKARLTTTRVAERAGVSVGTLYQYFPNKTALLQAVLRHHLSGVGDAVEAACAEARGSSFAEMALAIASGFVAGKFQNIDASVALYAVSDDLDGRSIAQETYSRLTKAIAALFATATDGTLQRPELVATTLLSAMSGISRTMLEAGVHLNSRKEMQSEIGTLVSGYLAASDKISTSGT